MINSLVSKDQSTFIKGRQILDSPLIMNEVLAWCKVKTKDVMVLKLILKQLVTTFFGTFLMMSWVEWVLVIN